MRWPEMATQPFFHNSSQSNTHVATASKINSNVAKVIDLFQLWEFMVIYIQYDMSPTPTQSWETQEKNWN